MWNRVLNRKAQGAAITSALLACLLLSAAGGGISALAQGEQPQAPEVAGPAFIGYQGLLLDPSTGNAKPDGTYQMVFAIYDVEFGGTALWSETKTLQVTKGLFNTMLGDQVGLPASILDGRTLWLGVTVGADPEATPRQKLGYSAGAIYAKNSDQLDGQHSTAFAAATHAHSGADITTGIVAEPRIDAAITRDSEIMTTVLAADGTGSGLDADMLDSFHYTAFARSTHAHSGADITSGTVAEVRIDPLIARDTEIMPTVLANDGMNSTLDADLLDGQHGSFYQSASNINAGTLNYGYFNAYGDLANDSRIGPGASQVAAGDHLHDSRYYTQAASESRYVNVTGDTMTGNLTVPAVTYTTPRQHVTSVPSEAFFPTSNVDYVNGTGSGGAWKPTGATGGMAATIQLPDGATVTKFRVYFYDNSAQNLQVYLDYQALGGSGYAFMASVTTSGASATYQYLETTAISYPVVDNVNNGYLIWAYPLNTWDDVNLRVKGASVFYTLDAAP